MTMTKLNLLSVLNAPRLGLFGAEDPGAAPAGYHSRSDVIETVPGQRGITIDGQSLSEIWSELTARNAAFNRTMDRIISLWTYPVARAQDRVAVPASKGFEQASEFGRPTKRRVQYVFRGFPLDHFDTGVGYTQEYLDSAPAREILSVADQIETDYTRLQMTTVLSALFNNANLTDMDGISVKRLYNADGEVPPAWKRYTHDGTHTHYLTSAALDVAAVTAMELHLVHHGFDGQLYLMANRTEMDDLRGLAGFVPAVGADRATVVNGDIIGGTRPTSLNGIPVQGYIGKFAIVEEDEIPSGYLVGFATGGTLSPSNVIGIRQHENPSARGLRLVQGPSQEYPLYDAYYDTYMGAGIRQRGAAVITQITAGAYAVPTFA